MDIRNLDEKDLDAADRLVAEAFSKHLGIEDPEQFLRGSSCFSRWYTEPAGVIGAFDGDRLIGVIFGVTWGSFGFFGPLCVAPDRWNSGVAKELLARLEEFFDKSGISARGLFTFPGSTKHIGLYQRFGYFPQMLTAVMEKKLPVASTVDEQSRYRLLSAAEEKDYWKAIDAIDILTGSIYSGLSLQKEIDTMRRFKLGDTVITGSFESAESFAVCHYGPRSEAGAGTCYVKFGAAANAISCADLISSVESFALSQGAESLVVGVNTARREAYGLLQEAGFKPIIFGIAMIKPDTAAFNQRGLFVFDDWR